jgi:NADPH2:quinone reductase
VPREIEVLAEEGRLILIATMGGTKAEVDLRSIMGRRLTITGSMLRRRSVEFKGAIATALRERVWPLLESGRVKPIVHATFPIDHASEAHRVLERGEHVGKLVLLA